MFAVLRVISKVRDRVMRYQDQWGERLQWQRKIPELSVELLQEESDLAMRCDTDFQGLVTGTWWPGIRLLHRNIEERSEQLDDATVIVGTNRCQRITSILKSGLAHSLQRKKMRWRVVQA